MTNQLQKKTSVSVDPGQEAIEGTPYQPARPAYTVTTTEYVCSLEWVTEGARSPGAVKVIDGSTGKITYEYDRGSPGTTSLKRVCRDVTTTTHYPAVPERPAQPPVAARPPSVTQDFNLGWNSGARSVKTIAGSGFAEFTVPQSVGVVIGFNSDDLGTSYVEITHGLYFAGRTFRVYESGVEKFYGGTFATSDVFRISREGKKVRYLRNGTEFYTSSTPSEGVVFLDTSMYSGGDTVDAPVLEDAQGESGDWSGSLRPLTGILANTAYAIFQGEMLPVGGSLTALKTHIKGTMRPLTGMWGNKPYAGFSGSMSPASGSMEVGLSAPTYALIFGQALPVSGVLQVLTGGIFSSENIMIPATGMWGDKVYGGFAGRMAPVGGYMADDAFTQPPKMLPAVGLSGLSGASAVLEPPAWVFNAYAAPSQQHVAQMQCPDWSLSAAGGATAAHSLPMGLLSASATTTLLGRAPMAMPAARLDAEATASIMGQASMTVGSTYALVGYAGALVSATIGACTLQAEGTGTITAAANLVLPLYELDAGAELENVGQAELVAPAIAAAPWAVAWMTAPAARMTAIGTAVVAVTHEAYAVNLRSEVEGGGNEVTRYTDYPFERIVRWRGSYYGMAADGLYLLEGNTDDDEPINWALRTGTTDFGRPEKKNTASAYMGGRLGGEATFTVHTGEKLDSSYAYRSTRGATAQNYRQKFGRGLDARYYAFQVEGNGELEIDDLEIEVVQRARRRL